MSLEEECDVDGLGTKSECGIGMWKRTEIAEEDEDDEFYIKSSYVSMHPATQTKS